MDIYSFEFEFEFNTTHYTAKAWKINITKPGQTLQFHIYDVKPRHQYLNIPLMLIANPTTQKHDIEGQSPLAYPFIDALHKAFMEFCDLSGIEVMPIPEITSITEFEFSFKLHGQWFNASCRKTKYSQPDRSIEFSVFNMRSLIGPKIGTITFFTDSSGKYQDYTIKDTTIDMLTLYCIYEPLVEYCDENHIYMY